MLRLRRAELLARSPRTRPGCARSRRGSGSSRGRAPCPARTSRSSRSRRPGRRAGGVAAGFEPEAIGPVIGPLYDRLCAGLEKAGVAWSGRRSPTTTTRPTAASWCTPACRCRPSPADGFTVVDLPAVERPPRSSTAARWTSDADHPDAGPVDRGQRLHVRRLQPRAVPLVRRGRPAWRSPSSRSRSGPAESDPVHRVRVGPVRSRGSARRSRPCRRRARSRRCRSSPRPGCG